MSDIVILSIAFVVWFIGFLAYMLKVESEAQPKYTWSTSSGKMEPKEIEPRKPIKFYQVWLGVFWPISWLLKGVIVWIWNAIKSTFQFIGLFFMGIFFIIMFIVKWFLLAFGYDISEKHEWLR